MLNRLPRGVREALVTSVRRVVVTVDPTTMRVRFRLRDGRIVTREAASVMFDAPLGFGPASIEREAANAIGRAMREARAATFAAYEALRRREMDLDEVERRTLRALHAALEGIDEFSVWAARSRVELAALRQEAA
jgi:hypothetical protein